MSKTIIRTIYLFLVSTLLCAVSPAADTPRSSSQSAHPNFREITKQIREGGLLERFTEKELKQYHRWNWFWRYRTGLDGDMGRASRVATGFLQQMTNRPDGPDGGPNSPTPAHWTPLGPIYPVAGYSYSSGIGRAQTIWVDPNDHDFMVVGAATGGAWKTVDGGVYWIPLTNNVITIGISDIEVNPANHDIIYLATGTQTNGLLRGRYGIGVLKTTNGGATWSNTSLSFDPKDQQMVIELLMDPDNPNILFAMTEHRIYRTKDGGANWSLLTELHDMNGVWFRDMKFKPGDSNTLYVCGANANWPQTGTQANHAIWRLDLDGDDIHETQVGLNFDLPADSETEFIALGVRDDQPDTVYAGYRVGVPQGTHVSHLKHFYKSTDEGLNWSLLSSPNKSYIANGFMDIDWSPNGNFYVTSYHLYRSGNELVSLSDNTAGMHVDIRQLELFPQDDGTDLLLAVTDGGVFRSSNSGATWAAISGTLQINQFYSVAVHESVPDLILGGTHDCGTIKHASSTWRMVSGGDGGSALIDRTNADHMFVTVNKDLLRSLNGGAFFYGTPIHMSRLDSPLLQHPTDADTFYSDNGSKRIYVSTNGGSNWSLFNDNSLGDGNLIAAMDICGSNPNYLYYATTNNYYDNGSLIRTNDGGGHWTVLDLPPELPLGITGLASLEINDTNPDEIWIGLGFFEEAHKVYHSSDGGVNWINESTGLPNFPVNRLLFDTDNDCLYAATDVGLYYKTASLDSWERYGRGLPYVLVADMKIHRSTGKLIVATYGRGMWAIDLYEAP